MLHLLSTVCQVVLYIFMIHEKNPKDRIITPILQIRKEIQRTSVSSSKSHNLLKAGFQPRSLIPKHVHFPAKNCFSNSNKELKKSDNAK